YLKVFDEYELEQIMIEPGRSLVGDAGILISEIILISHRPKLGCKRWIYTDVGVFNGLIETIGESVEYPVLSNRTGEVGSVIIA
ncbi:type III PLP-dependent enzyme, partial [Pseudomonas syringae]